MIKTAFLEYYRASCITCRAGDNFFQSLSQQVAPAIMWATNIYNVAWWFNVKALGWDFQHTWPISKDMITTTKKMIVFGKKN